MSKGLDPEAIASRLLTRMPREKANQIAVALDWRLLTWRVGSCDLHLLQQR